MTTTPTPLPATAEEPQLRNLLAPDDVADPLLTTLARRALDTRHHLDGDDALAALYSPWLIDLHRPGRALRKALQRAGIDGLTGPDWTPVTPTTDRTGSDLHDLPADQRNELWSLRSGGREDERRHWPLAVRSSIRQQLLTIPELPLDELLGRETSWRPADSHAATVYLAGRRGLPLTERQAKALAPQARDQLATGTLPNLEDPDSWEPRSESWSEVIATRSGIDPEDVASLTDEALAAAKAGTRLDPDDETHYRPGSPTLLGRAASRYGLEHRDLGDLTTDAHEQLLSGGTIDPRSPTIWRRGSRRFDERVAELAGIARGDVRQLAHQAIGELLAGGTVDPELPMTWRLGAPRWQQLMEQLHGPLEGEVQQPIGLLVHPSRRDDGWVTRPVFSLPMLRLLHQHGFEVDRDLNQARGTRKALLQVVDALNTSWLIGRRRSWDSAHERHEQLGELGLSTADLRPVADAGPTGQWAGLTVRQQEASGQIVLSVGTRQKRGFPARRFGTGDRDGLSAGQDLGELIAGAGEIGLPAVLTSEALKVLDGQMRIGRSKGIPGQITFTEIADGEARTEALPARAAAARLAKLRLRTDQGPRITIDRAAATVLQMAAARPLSTDEVLLEPQRQVAGALAAGSGVNASEVGTGKTVISGRGLWHLAKREPRFRALITVPQVLVSQWVQQLQEGHHAIGQPLAPGVRVATLDHNRHGDLDRRLLALHRQAGDEPLAIVCSHGTLEHRAAQLSVIGWQLLICDEGHHAANPQSGLHQALMDLRVRRARQCWVLTGTPKGKSTADLDVLVGLALGDRDMVDGRIASSRAGDTLTDRSASQLMSAYGATVQRIRSHEMAAFKPKLGPAKPIMLDPDPGLARLLQETTGGGREAYCEMRRWLGEVKVLRDAGRVDGDLYQAALAEWRRAQAAVLAIVGVLQDLSVDPQVLEHSSARIAGGLVKQPSYRDAITAADGLPTLRATVIDQVLQVMEDVPVVLACQRIRPLRLLSQSLHDLHGVQAPVLAGDLDAVAVQEILQRFNDDETRVLLLGPVGQTGLDLQHAGAMGHLDVPWTPTPMSQRLGRVERPGSEHDEVHQWIPFVRGGLVPHMVSHLAPRMAEAHLLLDGIAGVRGKDTAAGATLGDLAALAADLKDEAGQEASGLQLKVASAIFS